jgi:ribosomal-protein-alanine N-acetyltransferase
MDASYSIRLAKDEDLDSIKKIEQEAFSDPWSDEAFANLTNSWSFVLIKDEEVIGYIFYYGVKEEKSILNFAVRSDFQGMGLGEFLLTETMQNNA